MSDKGCGKGKGKTGDSSGSGGKGWGGDGSYAKQEGLIPKKTSVKETMAKTVGSAVSKYKNKPKINPDAGSN